MRLRRFPEQVERAAFVDPVADGVAAVVGRALPPGPVKDLLSGTWLGHAVHPMLTDLPIGFWTSAFVLDLVGGRTSAPAARKLVGLGVLSALPTAVTGLSDWADTAGGEKRVGAVHATANLVALSCYVASWKARRQGRRFRGVLLGLAGAGAATVGGYLGGHLIAAFGTGVDNTAFEGGPRDWRDAGPAPDLAAGPVAVTVDGVEVLVAAVDGDRAALSDRCTHRGGPLHEGSVERGCVTCPWHGSVFALGDGEVVRGPATFSQPRYETRVRAGRLEVRAAPTSAAS
ncbi:MAG TPA: Rieske (2Fe-2S) protein [Acidimicrobiales bacterium]|nr:Rieske (2Fe-2S) protein [Acidimicrobiales bacterium]